MHLRFCFICSFSSKYELRHRATVLLNFCNSVYGCMKDMTKKQSDYNNTNRCRNGCPRWRWDLLEPVTKQKQTIKMKFFSLTKKVSIVLIDKYTKSRAKSDLQCISCFRVGSPKSRLLMYSSPVSVTLEPYILIGADLLVVSYTFTTMVCLLAS